MARSHLRSVVRGTNGLAVQNARAVLYVHGTNTVRTDAYDSESSGSLVTFLTSNSQGEIEAWLDTGGEVDVEVTDNSGAAFYSLTGSRAPLTPTRESVTIGTIASTVTGDFVDLTTDQTVAGKKKWTGEQNFNNVVYVKSDPWIDPRHPDFGNWDANPTASIQAAVTEWSTGANPNIILPSGNITLTNSIAGGRNGGLFIGHGKSKTVFNGGVNGQPLFLFRNTGNVRFSDFSCAPSPASGTVTAGIEIRRDDGVAFSGTPTGNIFSNLSIGSSLPQWLTDGILYSLAAGSFDANNDLAEFYSIYGGYCTGSLLRFTHSQSKGHGIYSIHAGQCANIVSLVDNTGHGNAGGHFSVFGGTGGVVTSTAFEVVTAREGILIQGVHCESVHRLYKQTSGQTALFPTTIIGCSNIGSSYTINPSTGAGTAVDPPTDEINHASLGPLTVIGCFFRRALASGADAPGSGKIVLSGTPSATSKCVATLFSNCWDTPGTYEIKDSLISRQSSIAGGNIVITMGNSAKSSGGNILPLPSKTYGAGDYLGAFTSSTAPTASSDLTVGQFYFDTGLRMFFEWNGATYRSMHTVPVNIVTSSGAASTIELVD